MGVTLKSIANRQYLLYRYPTIKSQMEYRRKPLWFSGNLCDQKYTVETGPFRDRILLLTSQYRQKTIIISLRYGNNSDSEVHTHISG